MTATQPSHSDTIIPHCQTWIPYSLTLILSYRIWEGGWGEDPSHAGIFTHSLENPVLTQPGIRFPAFRNQHTCISRTLIRCMSYTTSTRPPPSHPSRQNTLEEPHEPSSAKSARLPARKDRGVHGTDYIRRQHPPSLSPSARSGEQILL